MEEFFCCQKSYGNTTRLKIFDPQFFFQFLDWPQEGTHIKNWFTTIKDRPISFFGNEGIFVGQNFYGYTSSFLRFFLGLCEWILTLLKIDYKWGSHWLGYIKHWLESKLLLARSPPGGFGGGGAPQGVDPLLPGRRHPRLAEQPR